MFGAEAATGTPRYSSIRCLAKVAACAELPRAQVTTTEGGLRCRRATSSATGRASRSAWRRTESGASRSSAAMLMSKTSRIPLQRLLLKRCEPAIGGARLPGEMGEMGDMMETERPSPRYSAIDLWRPADILDAMLEGQFAAVAAVHAARPALERAALAVEERLRGGGRLVYAGAGTSGRLAVQDGAELMPTFGWPASRLVLLMAGGRDALLRAVEGAEDEADEAAALVEHHAIGDWDALIAVAASGTTPFTLGVLREAGSRGALTVGIANNPNTPILDESDHPIRLDTGAEPIAGSTRMKAGTAQRVALTLLSSLVMIRLGHVYQGLMVDVQATNSKLVRRSEKMLAQLTGHGAESVRKALQQADGSVKLALLLLEGVGLDDARAALDRSSGDLRSAKTVIESRRSQKRRA